MSSIKAILKIDKIRANGEAPLYVRIIKDRKPKYKSLGIYIDPKHWDEIGMKVKKSYPNSVRANNLIAQRIATLNDSLLRLETEEGAYQAQQVFEAISDKRSVGFLEYSDRIVSRMESVNAIGMINRTRAVISKVREYLKGKDIPITDISVTWLKDYEAYLRTHLKNQLNTVASNTKIIRKILNEAESEDLIATGKNPFDRYQIKTESTEVEYLTEEELTAFMAVPLNEGTRIAQHRDLYVFACYAGGIRIGDLLKLQWKSFDGERLNIITTKTGEPLSIKLGRVPLEILQKQSEHRDSEGLVFNLLPENIDLADKKAIHVALSGTTAYINKNLKLVAKKAGIKKNIHFHTSRHTWATRALRKGMRIEHVSKLLTHRSIKTTQVYAKIVNADLDEAMDVFND
jgi:integrase/recombinase XerD